MLNNELQPNNEEIVSEINLTACKQKINEKRNLSVVVKRERSSFICNWPNCDKQYANAYGLKRHMRTHAGEKFKCHLCDKKYMHSENLVKHLRVHSTCQINKIKNNMVDGYENQNQIHNSLKEGVDVGRNSKSDALLKKSSDDDSNDDSIPSIRRACSDGTGNNDSNLLLKQISDDDRNDYFNHSQVLENLNQNEPSDSLPQFYSEPPIEIKDVSIFSILRFLFWFYFFKFYKIRLYITGNYF